MALEKSDRVFIAIEEKSERSYLPIIGPYRGKMLAEIIRKANLKRVLASSVYGRVTCSLGSGTVG